MIQTWILRQEYSPTQAVREDKDVSVCGDCALRKGICYVLVHQAPQAVWKSYRDGKYKYATGVELRGLPVRLGSYGDPVAVPPHIIRTIVKHARTWTGYTHQWRLPGVQQYKPWLMASVDTEDERLEARRMGWRTFRTAREEELELMPGEIMCPHYTHNVTCLECRLCDGTKGGRFVKDIVTALHGRGAN
jgi:hypothetical protein